MAPLSYLHLSASYGDFPDREAPRSSASYPEERDSGIQQTTAFPSPGLPPCSIGLQRRELRCPGQ